MALDVEDLELDATPEDLMLSYVSGEKGKVSRDKLLITSCSYSSILALWFFVSCRKPSQEWNV